MLLDREPCLFVCCCFPLSPVMLCSQGWKLPRGIKDGPSVWIGSFDQSINLWQSLSPQQTISEQKEKTRKSSIDLHIHTKDCSWCLLPDNRLAEIGNPKDLRAHSALALTALPAALARPAHTAPPLVRSPRPASPRSAGAPLTSSREDVLASAPEASSELGRRRERAGKAAG